MKEKRKLVIAYIAVAVLLILCLCDMPYGYFTLVRYVSTAAFCYFAYNAYRSKNIDKMIVFIALALLFQPFFKVSLGRGLWNIVDVAVAFYMLYLAFKTHK